MKCPECEAADADGDIHTQLLSHLSALGQARAVTCQSQNRSPQTMSAGAVENHRPIISPSSQPADSRNGCSALASTGPHQGNNQLSVHAPLPPQLTLRFLLPGPVPRLQHHLQSRPIAPGLQDPAPETQRPCNRLLLSSAHWNNPATAATVSRLRGQRHQGRGVA